MTQVTFQRVLGRLVTDRDFRARPSLRAARPFPGLSALERRPPIAIARPPGLSLPPRPFDSFPLGQPTTLPPPPRALARPSAPQAGCRRGATPRQLVARCNSTPCAVSDAAPTPAASRQP